MLLAHTEKTANKWTGCKLDERTHINRKWFCYYTVSKSYCGRI